MVRFSVLKIVRTGSLFLLLGTPLFFLFFWKDNIYCLPTDVREDDSQTKAQNKSYVYSWPKCERNESAANVTGFSSLPDHIKDFLFYRHCRHFPMLQDVPDKCGGANKSAEVFLLLVIKSAPRNYDRRQVLRKTWAKERQYNGVWIRRTFISATAASGLEKEKLNKLLEFEQREYGDILQWDFHDTFYNLTLKQTLFLEWVQRNCPNVRFLLNGDDDVFANTNLMIEYLQSLDNDGSKHLFTGNLLQKLKPIRRPESKYYNPVQVQETDSYPTFCSGGGYILSGYTAFVLYNMSQSVELIPIDDAYMGMCLAKAELEPTGHIAFKPAIFNVPSKKIKDHPCFYTEMLIIHRLLPPDLYTMWNMIHDPNLKCAMNKLI